MSDDKDTKVKDAKTKESSSVVMDVKPLKTNEDTKSNAESSLPDWPTEDENNTATKPETSETSLPEAEKTTEAKPASNDSSDNDKVENPMAITGDPAKKKANLTVILALIIFALLVVAAYFAYSNNKSTTTSKSTNKSSSTTATSQVTTADVDQTANEVDKSLDSANDNSDFASTDLSDSSLGL